MRGKSRVLAYGLTAVALLGVAGGSLAAWKLFSDRPSVSDDSAVPAEHPRGRLPLNDLEPPVVGALETSDQGLSAPQQKTADGLPARIELSSGREVALAETESPNSQRQRRGASQAKTGPSHSDKRIADGSAEQPDSEAVAPPPNDASRPAKVPQPEGLSPIDEGESSSAGQDSTTARKIIEQELPNASREERKVWLEELEGMPPQMMRELLRLRENFGSEGPSLFGPDLPEDTSTPSPPRPRPTTKDSATVRSSVWRPSRVALQQARQVLLHNIANGQTIGFKRYQPVFRSFAGGTSSLGSEQTVSAPGRGAAQPRWGVRLAGVELDWSQGPMRKTGQPLNLAIEGAGCFAVRNGSETLYTRRGRFTRTSDGRLALPHAEDWLLEPAIEIPADARSLHIAADGHVRVKRGDRQKPNHLGRIELARFVNPAGLQPRNGNLFAATAASGSAQRGLPLTGGRGKLRQGYLEESNVVRDEEMTRLERLRDRLKLLPERDSGKSR